MKKIILLIIVITFSQINFAQTTVLYDDFTTSNSLTDNWTLSGDPKPVWVSSAFGRTGLFDNNGDGWYSSAGYSKSLVGSPNGFTVSAEVYLNVTDQAGCWLDVGIGLTKATNPQPMGSSGDLPEAVHFSLAYDGDACWASPTFAHHHCWFYAGVNVTEDGSSDWAKEFQINGDPYANGWHLLEIVVGPDRLVKFYCDKNLIWSSTKKIDPSMMTNRNVVLGSRSSGSAGKAYHDWVGVTNSQTTNIVIQGKESPEQYSLVQNFPNPFNPTTKIKFDIPKESHVKLAVYDVLGREVETLVNEYKLQGNYEVKFDGSSLPSGVYFYQLRAGNFTETKKLVLLK